MSRQLYLYRILTNIRGRFNWLTSLLVAIPWRFGIYPWRMYFRPVWFMMYYAVVPYSICYWPTRLALRRYSGIDDTITPPWYTYFLVMWLLLHVFDLFRGIEYITHNPRNIFPGCWTDLTIRICATSRPLIRIVIVVIVALARLETNMSLAEYYNLPFEMARSTFHLSLICGTIEVFIYWLVGFFARRRRLAYSLGGHEVGAPVERWEVEVVLPWSTAAAAFYAVWYLRIFVMIARDRGWWFIPEGTGYRGAGDEISGVRVVTKMILLPRSTGCS